jgi:uncharacterized protein
VIAGVLLLAGGAAAGLFGSLLGLGGGVLIVPLLTLGFGRPLREAVAVSLVCVIVTSSAAAGRYLRGRTANLRLSMLLSLFTAGGALLGGLIAFLVAEAVLAGLFAVLLTYVALTMARPRRPAPAAPQAVPTPPAAAPVLVARDTHAPGPDGAAPADGDDWLSGPDYRVRRVRPASATSVGAGIISALLGIGGGIINVPTMHLLMGVPLRVATATSNLMIGVTAVAPALLYTLRGELDPYIAGPTALGVFVGANIGARTAHRVDVRILRWLFVVVLGYTAIQMARRALGA